MAKTGRPAGVSAKVAPGYIAGRLSMKFVEFLEEMANSPRKEDRKWAFDKGREYCFQRMPQAVELSGKDGGDIITKIDVVIHNGPEN